MLSVTVLILWVAPPEMFCFGIGFNGAETNCRIAHILGILLINSCNTDIFFSNYYHLQSVRFELVYTKTVDSVERALIGSSNSEYPVLFTSEQLAKKWRPSLHP